MIDSEMIRHFLGQSIVLEVNVALALILVGVATIYKIITMVRR
jgi:hypothetical protein